MTPPDQFRQLGQDLLTFANDPVAALGKFKGLPAKDTVHSYDQALTPRWVVTRIRNVHSSVGTIYTWRTRKGIAQALKHTLYVETDTDGVICRFILGCAIAVDLIYETTYCLKRSEIEMVVFCQRRIIDPEHDVWQFLGKPPMLIDEALGLIPAGMRKSFGKAELTSV